MAKRKAPAPANELEAGKQGASATGNNFDSAGLDAQGAQEQDCGESTRTRGEAARNGEKAARIERAIQLIKQADSWVREHEDVWAFVCRACVAEAEAGRQTSMQWASEMVRRKNFASFKKFGGGINNRYRPVLARRLVREHPECAPFIELRRSILDLVDEEAVDGR